LAAQFLDRFLTFRKWFAVLLIAIAMLSILILSGAIVAYVAFPHRGEEMPAVPWLGTALGKARQALPTQDYPEDFYEAVGQRRN
jgi:hypothetical protein